MLFAALVLSLSVASAAPGQIYRCTKADGSVGFQDQPCAGQQGTKLDGDADAAQLRQWLRQFPKERRAAPAAGSAARTRPPADFTMVSESQLAVCSERFLACASGDAGKMDRCIAALPRCSASRNSQCCPSSCISAYQTLRRSGNKLSAAVHDALMAPGRPSCAPPD